MTDVAAQPGRTPAVGHLGGHRLLVVEDDDGIAEPLVEGLAFEGFEVDRARTGAEALAAAPEADLVLLDLGLPDLDGLEVCRRLRARAPVPVIVVTARADEIDRVLLLEIGADDYVVKPFGFRELVARIRAVQRRADGMRSARGERQELGSLVLDRGSRRVRLAGDELDLSPKEFDLLSYLAEEPSQVRTREDIIAHVWDKHWWGPTKTLDVHVASLRRKLGDPAWIATLRGVGYRLDPPS
jgi:two-component system response regulator RegX3